MSSKITSLPMDSLEILKKTTFKVKIASVILILLILFLFGMWGYRTLHRNSSNCGDLSDTYPNFPTISTINTSDPNYGYNLRDYYIKSAFNACCAGNFKNDFVNICGLKNAIKQGARCLDFEIYSLNDEPIIATSSVNDYYTKETFNSVDFNEAMGVVSNYAFSSGTCPNSGDPLILNFRIMSSNKPIYDKMASALYTNLSDRLLGKEYSYEFKGKNLGAEPLNKLMGKVIIIVDRTNPMFQQTKLNEYVNQASGGAFMRSYTFSQVKNVQDMDELVEYNKKSMSIVRPDLSSKNVNYSSQLMMNYGCQLIGMCFQNNDNYMKYYTSFFNQSNSAFVLKPENLRYIPVTIPVPPPQNPAYSYETRVVEEDYYNFNI